MSRSTQLRLVDPSHQAEWIASELDESEARLLAAMGELRAEVTKLRQVMTGLLVSICVALIVIPVTLFVR